MDNDRDREAWPELGGEAKPESIDAGTERARVTLLREVNSGKRREFNPAKDVDRLTAKATRRGGSREVLEEKITLTVKVFLASLRIGLAAEKTKVACLTEGYDFLCSLSARR
ncbi:hypothetical protein [Paraburkholderia sp. MM5477-R1]|uniref:hypothetical protein n=1 Tax=Paraburkholderia sp. MM5477-R1 TaxID=2991062 RepID=UPI003D2542EC